MDGSAPEPLIHGAGTAEATWLGTPALHQLDQVSVAELMAGYRRLVVLAPHPDDEVLGCGGLMMLAAPKFEVVVFAVTDGEASHPHQNALIMRVRRARERDLALADLQMFSHQAKRMAFADGGVSAALPELTQMLTSLTSAADLVVVPWQGDGHPDHEACAAAGLAAQAASGFGLLQYPVWGWHWCDPMQFPFEQAVRLELDAKTCAAKERAMSRFTSQTESQGMPPVLTASTLERFRRPFEVFLK